MSAETVIGKIEEKAAAEIDAIQKEAEKQAEASRKSILAEAESKASAIRREAEEQAERVVSVGKQQSGLEARLSFLQEKRKLLADLRESVKRILLQYDETETANILTKLAAEAPFSGEVFVKIAEKDAGLFESGKLLDEWSRTFSQKFGKMVQYRLASERAAIDGGMFLSGDHYDVDCSLDTVLDTLFESHEKEIADCLFGSGS